MTGEATTTPSKMDWICTYPECGWRGPRPEPDAKGYEHCPSGHDAADLLPVDSFYGAAFLFNQACGDFGRQVRAALLDRWLAPRRRR